ncbi:TPA: phage recombination protein Bet [Escherichia coli]|nr:phage recombination protein Bet [Escherichia coli]
MDSVDPQELITTLRQTAFKGDASDAQFIALLIVANQYGLNPWTKEIYAFPDKQNGIVPVVGVDGWSRIINENQQFDGMDFEQDNESCTCRIYRKDRKRIMFREYDRLIITKGYPKRDDSSRRIDVPYDGYEVKTITHPHFGDKPVKVFAIKVNISTEYQSAQHKVKNVQSDLP